MALMLSLCFMLSGCADNTASLDVEKLVESSPEVSVESGDKAADSDFFVEEPADQSQAETAASSSFIQATVTRLVDGDTADVQYGDGSTHRIRFIGVNTPETKHPTKGVEYYGQEASDYTKSMLLNKQVYLQKDVSEMDKYNRELRYVWLEVPSNESSESEIRSKMFNSILLLNGYANAMTYPPDVKYAEYFESFEAEARSGNIGLWAAQGAESSTTGSFADKSATDQSFSYMGNSNSGKFHRTDCKYAVKTSEGNRVYFGTREEAINEGYVPCKVCNP